LTCGFRPGSSLNGAYHQTLSRIRGRELKVKYLNYERPASEINKKLGKQNGRRAPGVNAAIAIFANSPNFRKKMAFFFEKTMIR
jgi:hypothetical protein